MICDSVGFVDFGMHNTMAWLAGTLMCANATMNLLVMWCHPDFRSGGMESTMDPTDAYSTNFIEQNPHLASKASQFVYEQAKQNPKMVGEVGAWIHVGGCFHG